MAATQMETEDDRRHLDKPALFALVRERKTKPLENGDVWYAVSADWFRDWKRYAGFSDDTGDNVEAVGEDPGDIDNSSIVDESTVSPRQANLAG